MNTKKSIRFKKILQFAVKISILCASLMSLAACVSKNSPTPEDPYENFNRKVFAFNRVVDKAVLRPVAKSYDVVLPSRVKKSVSNFFSNLGDVPNVGNDLLQANFVQSESDIFRFAINSTLGIAGLFDVASNMGIPKHHQDFGLTLAKWGNTKSHYIVLPILGPSTLRDTAALPADYFTNLTTYIDSTAWRYGLKTTELVSRRAQLLPTDKIVNEAFDPYILVRDAYLQKRASLINANNDKLSGFDEDFENDLIKDTAAKN